MKADSFSGLFVSCFYFYFLRISHAFILVDACTDQFVYFIFLLNGELVFPTNNMSRIKQYKYRQREKAQNKWFKKEKKADQSDLRPVKTLSGRFCICLKILKASLGQSTV